MNLVNIFSKFIRMILFVNILVSRYQIDKNDKNYQIICIVLTIKLNAKIIIKILNLQHLLISLSSVKYDKIELTNMSNSVKQN